MKHISIVLILFIFFFCACAPSLREQSDARQADAVTSALMQSTAQQNQMLADLRAERAAAQTQINTLREQNSALVMQFAAQQNQMLASYQRALDSQTALVNLLVLVLGIVAVALAVTVLLIVIAASRRKRARAFFPTPIAQPLPAPAVRSMQTYTRDESRAIIVRD